MTRYKDEARFYEKSSIKLFITFLDSSRFERMESFSNFQNDVSGYKMSDGLNYNIPNNKHI